MPCISYACTQQIVPALFGLRTQMLHVVIYTTKQHDCDTLILFLIERYSKAIHCVLFIERFTDNSNTLCFALSGCVNQLPKNKH